MAIDRDATGTPEEELTELGRKVRPVQPGLENQTLAYKLVTVVDIIRQIPTSLGIRPYRVYLVHGSWSGGRQGAGTLAVTSRREILPTPRVRSMGDLAQLLRSTGVTEEGDLVVDRISAKYTEDDLKGATPDLRDPNLPRTTAIPFDFWWEIQEQHPQSPQPVIRRFGIVGVPEIGRGRVEWVVKLAKQDWDRGRTGSVARGAL